MFGSSTKKITKHRCQIFLFEQCYQVIEQFTTQLTTRRLVLPSYMSTLTDSVMFLIIHIDSFAPQLDSICYFSFIFIQKREVKFNTLMPKSLQTKGVHSFTFLFFSPNDVAKVWPHVNSTKL